MEYLIGAGVLIVALVVSMLAVQLFEKLKERMAPKPKGPRYAKPALVCQCPVCQTDLYPEIQAMVAKRPLNSPVNEITQACAKCQCVSVWLPLGEPPQLRRHRPHEAKEFIEVAPAQPEAPENEAKPA